MHSSSISMERIVMLEMVLACRVVDPYRKNPVLDDDRQKSPDWSLRNCYKIGEFLFYSIEMMVMTVWLCMNGSFTWIYRCLIWADYDDWIPNHIHRNFRHCCPIFRALSCCRWNRPFLAYFPTTAAMALVLDALVRNLVHHCHQLLLDSNYSHFPCPNIVARRDHGCHRIDHVHSNHNPANKFYKSQYISV